MDDRAWEPDYNPKPYMPLDTMDFPIERYEQRVQVDPIMLHAPERIHRTEEEILYQFRASVARRTVDSAEFSWPRDWKEAAKDAFYPWLARWEHRLMPLRSARGARIAGWLQERWPVKREYRRIGVWEYLDKQYLEKHQSHMAITVQKPVPIGNFYE